jgi:hypothetical protein
MVCHDVQPEKLYPSEGFSYYQNAIDVENSISKQLKHLSDKISEQAHYKILSQAKENKIQELEAVKASLTKELNVLLAFRGQVGFVTPQSVLKAESVLNCPCCVL